MKLRVGLLLSLSLSLRDDEVNEMDVNTVIQLINGVGFPIVACGGMFWLYIRQNKTFNNSINKFTECIDNNTESIKELASIIKEHFHE